MGFRDREAKVASTSKLMFLVHFNQCLFHNEKEITPVFPKTNDWYTVEEPGNAMQKAVPGCGRYCVVSNECTLRTGDLGSCPYCPAGGYCPAPAVLWSYNCLIEYFKSLGASGSHASCRNARLVKQEMRHAGRSTGKRIRFSK